MRRILRRLDLAVQLLPGVLIAAAGIVIMVLAVAGVLWI